MMRKKIINKKVIRAISLGLSAVMLTTPMTAMASDGTDVLPEDNDNKVEQQEKKESSVCDTAQEASQVADAAVEEAAVDVAAVNADVVVNVEKGEAGTDVDGNDLSQAVIDAAENVENPVSENGAPIADADTDIQNVETQLAIAEASDALAEAEVKKAEAAVEDASDTAGEAVKIVEEANEKADEHLDNIKNAETIADANAAHDELGAAVTKAKTDLDAKVEEYNTAKDNYDKAVAKVAEYEKAYNEAIATAGANAEEAAKELEEAKANAEALNKAVEEAKKAVDGSVDAAKVIAASEDKTENDGGLNWGNQDELFKTIMINYYIPEVLGIKGSNASVERIQGIDNDEYNYFEVICPNGTKKYYNYKMKDNNTHESKLVIFEKREVEISGDSSKTPDCYVVDGTEEVVDVEAGLKDGTVVETGEGYALKKNDGTQVSLKGVIIQNQNWKNGTILLDQETDAKYRKFVDDVEDRKIKYQRLSEESLKAEQSVETAKTKVEELKEAINELKGKADKSEELGKLSMELVAAEVKLAVAQENYEDLEVKLEDAAEELDKVIEELTPNTINTEVDDKDAGAAGGEDSNVMSQSQETANPETPVTAIETAANPTAEQPAVSTLNVNADADQEIVDDEDSDEEDGVDINVISQSQGAANPVTPVTAIETAANPTTVQPAVNTPNADAGQAIVNIEDEATPLAAGIDETEDITDAQKEDVEDAIVMIEDEAAPLAPTMEEKAEMSWWWLLIIALLGATGYKMYKEHQKKKEEAQNA